MRDLANAVQSQGRGNDTMLVHMTPKEVGGLQALAMANGGSLTINPETGLPEAGFLDNLLPTILGVGLSLIPGVGPLMAAGIVGGGTALATGDIGKGLMAGLGAYGGANLSGALSGAGAANAAGASAATGAAGQAAADPLIAQMAAENAAFGAGAGDMLTQSLQYAGANAPGVAQSAITAGAAQPTLSNIGAGISGLGSEAGRSNLMSSFGQQFGQMGTGEKIATGLGAANAFGAFEQPAMQPLVIPEEESNYEGPYLPTPRQVRYPGPDRTSTSEFMYFTPSNPVPFAEGGATEDRALKMPGADYQPGTSPEFDYGFRPIEIAQQPSAPAPGLGGKGGRMASAMAQGQSPLAAEDQSPIVGYTGSGDPIYRTNPMEQGGLGLGGLRGDDATGFNLRRMVPTEDEIEDSNYIDLSSYRYNPATQRMEYMAKGGEVRMEDGGFVMDARSVSEIGNGSSNAGLEKLARLGARPIQGRGDGVSDSIPANIGGSQKARVARDEAYFSPAAVEKLGGSQKLYAMMDKAHKSRKNAKRGQDTGGLKALMA